MRPSNQSCWRIPRRHCLFLKVSSLSVLLPASFGQSGNGQAWQNDNRQNGYKPSRQSDEWRATQPELPKTASSKAVAKWPKRPLHQYATHLRHREHEDGAKHRLERSDAPLVVMRQSQYPSTQKCLMALYAGNMQFLYCKARIYRQKTLQSLKSPNN